MKETDPWYKMVNEEEVATPALLVYPDRVQKNIQTALKMTGGADRLRQLRPVLSFRFL